MFVQVKRKTNHQTQYKLTKKKQKTKTISKFTFKITNCFQI